MCKSVVAFLAAMLILVSVVSVVGRGKGDKDDKYKEQRNCFHKDFRKRIKEWMNLEDKPKGDNFCDILRNHPNTPLDYNCTYCMVCDPKSGQSYCNAAFGDIHGGVTPPTVWSNDVAPSPNDVMDLALVLLMLAMATGLGIGTMGI